MGRKYQATKQYAKKPKITPLGLFFIAISIIFFIAVQTEFFKQWGDLFNVACYISFIIGITLSGTNGEGKLVEFIQRGINILKDKTTKRDRKYNKLFDLFLSIALAMGILYEEMGEEEGYMEEPEEVIIDMKEELKELDKIKE